ncbi:hypothetical protein RRG08_022602 [Elysia crispata]|uniref:Uncharacterized protein n=1 Tax=Elysia crispata TaxID=231223 RepID=A0AAE0Z3I4_9GAST|nr:hypothetical protein RRG08_022602 [Elysia crispata]
MELQAMSQIRVSSSANTVDNLSLRPLHLAVREQLWPRVSEGRSRSSSRVQNFSRNCGHSGDPRFYIAQCPHHSAPPPAHGSHSRTRETLLNWNLCCGTRPLPPQLAHHSYCISL